ncbi:hypothetical protein C8Q73DRAFT_71229 [Cubamyces lactineus]|nr:hypothetical protein C8Q73DRAFT_71229 [Cubamyces lactineus]
MVNVVYHCQWRHRPLCVPIAVSASREAVQHVSLSPATSATLATATTMRPMQRTQSPSRLWPTIALNLAASHSPLSAMLTSSSTLPSPLQYQSSHLRLCSQDVYRNLSFEHSSCSPRSFHNSQVSDSTGSSMSATAPPLHPAYTPTVFTSLYVILSPGSQLQCDLHGEHVDQVTVSTLYERTTTSPRSNILLHRRADDGTHTFIATGCAPARPSRAITPTIRPNSDKAPHIPLCQDHASFIKISNHQNDLHCARSERHPYRETLPSQLRPFISHSDSSLR